MSLSTIVLAANAQLLRRLDLRPAETPESGEAVAPGDSTRLHSTTTMCRRAPSRRAWRPGTVGVEHRVWNRRRFLTTGGAAIAGVWLAGCSNSGSSRSTASAPSGQLVVPSDPAITAREAQRRSSSSGSTVVDLVAGALAVDLGGIAVDTTGYGDSVPGPVIRVRAGDELTVRFRNQLVDPTVVHWHGLAIRNDMDGVPGLTQDPIGAGEDFTYRFVVPDPGTYWFHPHMGLDLDRGMYAAIIVDDPNEAGDYDAEEILIFDDWIDGIDGGSPTKVLADLQAAGGMAHGGMAAMSEGSDASGRGMGMNAFGDVDYPLHLINGRAPRIRSRSVLQRVAGSGCG